MLRRAILAIAALLVASSTVRANLFVPLRNLDELRDLVSLASNERTLGRLHRLEMDLDGLRAWNQAHPAGDIRVLDDILGSPEGGRLNGLVTRGDLAELFMRASRVEMPGLPEGGMVLDRERFGEVLRGVVGNDDRLQFLREPIQGLNAGDQAFVREGSAAIQELSNFYASPHRHGSRLVSDLESLRSPLHRGLPGRGGVQRVSDEARTALSSYISHLGGELSPAEAERQMSQFRNYQAAGEEPPAWRFLSRERTYTGQELIEGSDRSLWPRQYLAALAQAARRAGDDASAGALLGVDVGSTLFVESNHGTRIVQQVRNRRFIIQNEGTKFRVYLELGEESESMLRIERTIAESLVGQARADLIAAGRFRPNQRIRPGMESLVLGFAESGVTGRFIEFAVRTETRAEYVAASYYMNRLRGLYRQTLARNPIRR